MIIAQSRKDMLRILEKITLASCLPLWEGEEIFKKRIKINPWRGKSLMIGMIIIMDLIVELGFNGQRRRTVMGKRNEEGLLRPHQSLLHFPEYLLLVIY